MNTENTNNSVAGPVLGKDVSHEVGKDVGHEVGDEAGDDAAHGAGTDEVAGALLLDVRRASVFAQADTVIAGARWYDPALVADWAQHVPPYREVVVYCVHGHEVSRNTAQTLRNAGLKARYLRGGMEAWRAAGGPLQAKPAPLESAYISRWVTRERPKIDRVACPWLILRFIDCEAEFLYVPASDVLRVAAETGATPYDIPGVEMSHVGEHCSFDAFINKYALADPALLQLALIVRGADTSRLDLAPQSAGLFALSLGLSRLHGNDHEMLRHGLVMYDALYAWCQAGQAETHQWPPKAG